MSTQYKSGLASMFSTAARNSSAAPLVQCIKCHRQFHLGVNGIEIDDGAICDNCGFVVRDVAGFAWTSKPKICMCFEIAGDNDNCPVHGHGQ